MGKKLKIAFPMLLVAMGKEIEIHDVQEYDDLNALADLLYQSNGNRSQPGYDYYLSQHPGENSMFKMACLAKWFNLEIGL